MWVRHVSRRGKTESFPLRALQSFRGESHLTPKSCKAGRHSSCCSVRVLVAWLTVGEPGSTHLKETREQTERKNIWGKKKKKTRGKEVQYIPRTSNIKCVLGIESMQEEERFGTRFVLNYWNTVGIQCHIFGCTTQWFNNYIHCSPLTIVSVDTICHHTMVITALLMVISIPYFSSLYLIL